MDLAVGVGVQVKVVLERGLGKMDQEMLRVACDMDLISVDYE